MTGERALRLTPALHALLARVREQLGVTTSCDVSVVDLAEVERAVGSAVPDAVIACLLARGKTLGTVAIETETRRTMGDAFDPPIPKRLRTPLVCFDHWGEYPMFSIGYVPTESRDEPPLVVWDHKKWVPVPELGLDDVAAFVRGRLVGIHRDDELIRLDLDAPPSPSALAAFAPRIMTPPAPLPRIVVHPKFGEGRVLRAVEGKLEIDFGAHGIKVLLERFVQNR